ncbi:hypothetical protein BCIN_09g01870 [Botrytis cinerea B05.10]|uniref:RBR-type E3 ubiquitin transferase n=1 Tax=Botryotinia fuckeliana (strain B05.10) TaxID=332648 RepID=A0A384JSF8_BOTFB|nr:hypothetical protein BCIN_09g01870 [Botrytis cinerea B05.10]ATZ53317.1 hypothetical protein BCIN_09g01870 [Botrytis cinerea B05.10]
MSIYDRSSNLPGFFLGRGISDYRRDVLQQIMKFSEQTRHSRYNKSQMIDCLNELLTTGNISRNKINAIETWLQRGATGSIADHHNPRKRGSSAPEAPQATNHTRAIKRPRRSVREEVVEAPEPQLKECSICAEERAFADFPDRITAGCLHDSSCCNTCLSQSIGAQIESIQWDQISCPECPELLSFDNVKSFASEADFARYDKNALLSYISNDPKFTNCLGPNCGDGQIHQDGENQPIMTCGTCSFKTCFTHKIPWHTGLTCGQFDVQNRGAASEQEKKSQRLIKRATKPCPSCNAPILKNKGCDHMTCTHCDYEFCWLCLADYETILTTSNAAHRPNCFHYRPDGSGPRYAF